MVVNASTTGPGPVLSITRREDMVILSWPGIFSNYTLQDNEGLATTNWIDVTNVPLKTGTLDEVTIVGGGVKERYYRLKAP